MSGSGLADQALEALREWPALTECRIGSAGAGLGLADGSRQIIHLHQSDEAELYLTWPAIVRLSPALAAVSPVRFTAGDAWVRIRLDATSDVALLMSLVSVAIQAIAHSAGQPGKAGQPACPRSRVGQLNGCGLSPALPLFLGSPAA